MGHQSASQSQEAAAREAPEAPPPDLDDESDYQILQKMLADLQDQSWLIKQEQLAVCIHNDEENTDIRLGKGSFGSVCPHFSAQSTFARDATETHQWF